MEFETYINGHMIGKLVYKGNWRRDKDTIILNSGLQPEDALESIIEKQNLSKITTIKISGYPLVYICNSQDSVVKPIKGVITLTGIYDTLNFVFVNGHDGQRYPIKYVVKQKGANEFEAFFIEIYPWEEAKTEKYLFRRNKLVSLPNRKKYKRVEMEEKNW